MSEQYFNTFLVEDVHSLDASRTGAAVDGYVILNIMEPLVRYMSTADGGYEVLPGGAKEWSSNDDETVWTFKLNQNRWEDGVPVTAYDYEYSFKRTADPATGSPMSWYFEDLGVTGFDYDEIDFNEFGIKAIDEETLEITLDFYPPYFFEALSAQTLTPQRQDFVENCGEQYGTATEFVLSCGPFKLDDWSEGSNIALVKNEEYWDVGNVALDKLNFAIIADADTAMIAFERGELDEVNAITAEWADRFKAMDGVNYVEIPGTRLWFALLNANDSILKNVNIRRALILGLDRDELTDLVYGGIRVPAGGWIVSAASVGQYNLRSEAGNIIEAMKAEYGDPKELLLKGMEELGLGDDPDTLDITYTFAATDQVSNDAGAYIQQCYKTNLGLEINVEFFDWGVFYDNFAQPGNYQMGQMSWGLFYNDPSDIFGLFKSTNDYVSTGWASEEYDALMQSAISESDSAKRLALYTEAERLLIQDEAAVLPIMYAILQHFDRDFVQGSYTMSGSFANYSYKWFDTSARP